MIRSHDHADDRSGLSRRAFVGAAFVSTASLAAARPARALAGLLQEDNPLFRISLAQWSLHRAFRGGSADPMDFARIAREDYGLDAIEYVNSFYKDKARDRATLDGLKKAAADHGVKSLLIMCDGEGALGDADPVRRTKAIENHHKWVEAARHLGCHSIRVNAQSSGTYEEQQKLAADGLRRLTEFADGFSINVIVENHGGNSSNGVVV